MAVIKNKIENKKLYTNLNFNNYLLKYLNIYKNNNGYESNYYLKKNILKNLSKNFLINNYYLFFNLSLYNLINNDLFFLKIEKKFNQNKSLKNFYHNKNLNFWRYFDFIYYNKNNNIGNLSSNSDYFNKFSPKKSNFIWSLKNCAKLYVNVSPNIINLLNNTSKNFIVNKFISLYLNNLLIKDPNKKFITNLENDLLYNFFNLKQKNDIIKILSNYGELNKIFSINILKYLTKKNINTLFLKNIINNYLLIFSNLNKLENQLNLRLLCCIFNVNYSKFKQLFNSELFLQINQLEKYSIFENSEVKSYLINLINNWLKRLLVSLKNNSLELSLREFFIISAKDPSNFLYTKVIKESIDSFILKYVNYPNILYCLNLFINNKKFINFLLVFIKSKIPSIYTWNYNNKVSNNNKLVNNLILLNFNNQFNSQVKFNHLVLNKKLLNLKYKCNNFLRQGLKLNNFNKLLKKRNVVFNVKFVGLVSNNISLTNKKIIKNKSLNVKNFNNNKKKNSIKKSIGQSNSLSLRRGVFKFINDFRWLNFYANSSYNVKDLKNWKQNKINNKLLNNKILLNLLASWYKVSLKNKNNKGLKNSNTTNLKIFDIISKRSFILSSKYNHFWSNIPSSLKSKILYNYRNNNNFKFNKWFEKYLVNLINNLKTNNSSLVFKLLSLYKFNLKYTTNKYNSLNLFVKPKLVKVKNKYDSLLYDFAKINFFDKKKKLYNKKNKFYLSSFLKLQLLKRQRFYNFNKKYKTFLFYFWRFKQFNNLNLSSRYWNKFNLFLQQNLLKNRFFNKFYHKKRFIWWDNKIKVKFPFNLNRFLLMNIRVKKNNTFITITDFSGKILLVKQCGALRATQRRYRNTFTANERLGILIKTYLNRFWWLNKFSTLSDKDKAVFKYKKFKRKLKKKKKLGKEPITMEELSHLGSLYNTAYTDRFIGSKKSAKDKEKDKSFNKEEYKNNKKLFLIIKMNFGVSPAKCLHIYRKFKRYKKLRLKYNIVSVVNVTPIAHNGLRGKKHRRKKARKRKKKI